MKNNMKKIIVLFFLSTSFFLFSQEQRTENANSAYTVINFKKAEFPGGEEAFRKELFKMIHGYIDMSKYAVNGVFVFSFDVDADGKIKNLDVSPKVKNSEMFIEDMVFCVKRIKTNWKPATENGVPVKTNYKIKINFISDHFD